MSISEEVSCNSTAAAAATQRRRRDLVVSEGSGTQMHNATTQISNVVTTTNPRVQNTFSSSISPLREGSSY